MRLREPARTGIGVLTFLREESSREVGGSMPTRVAACNHALGIYFHTCLRDASRREVGKSLPMWCARACTLGRRSPPHTHTLAPISNAHAYLGAQVRMCTGHRHGIMHARPGTAPTCACALETGARVCTRAWPVQTAQYGRNPNTVTQPTNHLPTTSQETYP